MPFGKASYLLILLLWAMPILALQWLVAPKALWRRRRLIVAAILLCGTYLSLCDHFAIARGIWQIREDGILGWRLQGHLPLEEALFFYLTVALCVQGFVMIWGYFAEKEEGRNTNA